MHQMCQDLLRLTEVANGAGRQRTPNQRVVTLASKASASLSSPLISMQF